MSRSMRAWGTAPLVLLSMGLAAGCGGSVGVDAAAGSTSPSGAATTPSSSAASPTASATPSSSPTATVDPAVAAVRADFGRYYASFITAVRARDEHQPDAISYSTAKQQDVLRSFIRLMRSKKIVAKGTPHDWIKDATAVGRRATLRYCEFDSSAYYVYASTGKKYVPVKDKWNAHNVALVHRGDHWQVDSMAFSKFSCKGAT
jgi:hypothetical protein